MTQIVRRNGGGGEAPRHQRVSDLITMLAEAFQAKITVATIEAYLIGTADLPIEAVEAACATAMVGSKWFPKVFELRQMAGAAASGGISANDRAIVSWGKVRAAIGAIGSYETVYFDDPIVTATIRRLGGWHHLCNTPAGEDLDTWKRKEFCELYEILSASGIDAEDAAPLPGLNGADGAQYTPRPPVRIVVGLPAVEQKLIRGVIREPKLLVAPESREFVKSLFDVPEDVAPVAETVDSIPMREIIAELEAAKQNPVRKPAPRDPRAAEQIQRLIQARGGDGKKESGAGRNSGIAARERGAGGASGSDAGF